MQINGWTWEDEMERVTLELRNIMRLRQKFEPIPEPSFRCNLVAGEPFRIVIYSLDDLPAAREVMRQAFGEWTDHLANRFFSCGHCITTWVFEGAPVEIWLECPVEDYPAELLNDGHCRWEARDGKTEYSFVCDANGD